MNKNKKRSEPPISHFFQDCSILVSLIACFASIFSTFTISSLLTLTVSYTVFVIIRIESIIFLASTFFSLRSNLLFILVNFLSFLPLILSSLGLTGGGRTIVPSTGSVPHESIKIEPTFS